MLEGKTNRSEAAARIIVVGVGGAICFRQPNDRRQIMIGEFITDNTDKQALRLCKAPTLIPRLGTDRKGLGSRRKAEDWRKGSRRKRRGDIHALKRRGYGIRNLRHGRRHAGARTTPVVAADCEKNRGRHDGERCDQNAFAQSKARMNNALRN